MKTRLLIITGICAAQCALPSIAAEGALEHQFRTDYEIVIRRAWKLSSSERSDEVRREVDQIVEGARISRPTFLQDGEKAPSDAELQNRWDKFMAFEGSFSARGFPFWEHYISLWKSRKMNPEQKVIFSRMIGFRIEEHEERNQGRNDRKG